MEMFRNANYNFIGFRYRAYAISGLAILLSFVAIIVRGGFNLSIDFTGGTLLHAKFEKPITSEERKILNKAIDDLGYSSAEIKSIGSNKEESNNEFQIIVKQTAKGTIISDKITGSLSTVFPNNPHTILKAEVVGPKIGKELGKNAIFAGLLSMLVILVYMGVRFSLPYGVGAVLTLFHDAVLTLGLFAVLGWEISLPVVAAILSIIGFSLNDTIVVFDRIRELLNSRSGNSSFEDIVNSSINETLSRTVITTGSTLLACFAILLAFINTEDTLKYFSGALLFGVGVGTFSSIYVSSPILIEWNKKWPIEKLKKE